MATHSSILVWKIPWTEEPGEAMAHGVTKSQTPLNIHRDRTHIPALAGGFFTTEPPGRPSVQFSRSAVSDSATPRTAARQASLSITSSRSLSKLVYPCVQTSILVSIESVMPSNHLILCCHLLLLPSIFPSTGSFQMSQLFASGGQSIGVSASASVLPMNTQA